MVTNRDTARATTPSALPNGFSVSSSPCATAATTGADARVRDGHDVGEQLQPRADFAVGTWAAQPILVHLIGCRQHVQTRQSLQRCPLPHPDQRSRTAFQRLRHPQRAGKHRMGNRGGLLSPAAPDPRRAPMTPAPPAAPPRRRSPASRAGWPGAGAPGPARHGPGRWQPRPRATPSAEPARQRSQVANLIDGRDPLRPASPRLRSLLAGRCGRAGNGLQ